MSIQICGVFRGNESEARQFFFSEPCTGGPLMHTDKVVVAKVDGHTIGGILVRGDRMLIAKVSKGMLSTISDILPQLLAEVRKGGS